MTDMGSILIVDDEIGPRESLRMILKPNYEVHTAANGYEALNFIGREKVDLVTLDLKMPGIPGMDVLREIRKLNNNIEVIIITGYGTLANAIEAIRFGAVDFISKPFNVTEIISIVGKSVERKDFSLKIKNLIQKIKDFHLIGEDGRGEALSNLKVCLQAPRPSEIHSEMKDSLQQLENLRLQKVSVNYLDFLKVLMYILESKEPYTSGHSERVCYYSDIIAQDLHFPMEQKEELQIATLLHDIGKIGLSKHLLEKINPSQRESQTIREHPLNGVQIIEPLAFSQDVTSAIRHHHERWDGKGYPDGLCGEQIPLFARIIALADSYDAMTSDRPYRKGLPLWSVQEEIERNVGIQFDPQLVFLFSKHLKSDGFNPSLYQASGLN